ncbi:MULTISPECIES: hypothetical protein [Paraburkholderia]|uniref:hypothetical protein n=1 Tax=Paraburkholderia TaxID=1822464 RepID=UPI00037515B1|nr:MULTISPECIES: hypothetical protein [Paraburkholderia]MDH6150603.1 hypothetical protein [Paraburkholderia sp. WSM4179]
MSAADIVERAAAMRVRLWIEGGRISMEGPASAVATIKPEIAAHKSEVLAHLRAAANDAVDCTGALIGPDGGAYLPWGPYLAQDNVRRLRAELFAMIADLAQAEGWTRERHADTMTRAVRGPLADLLPNIEYFSAKVRELRAEATAREVMAARSWKYDSRIR